MIKKSSLFALLGLVTLAHAADAPSKAPASDDKSNTLVYRAETPNKVWDGWGGLRSGR